MVNEYQTTRAVSTCLKKSPSPRKKKQDSKTLYVREKDAYVKEKDFEKISSPRKKPIINADLIIFMERHGRMKSVLGVQKCTENVQNV